MNRRDFLQIVSASGGAFFAGNTVLNPTSARGQSERAVAGLGKHELQADVIVAGAGLGGCAAALAALRSGLRVVMTEETDWIGGQITQQGVPPDEHAWIEQFGATRTYRNYRTAVRDYYRRNYPLTETARAAWNLNPGAGSVSRLCHEPRVTLAVLYDLLNPYLSSNKLLLLLEHKIVSADVDGDNVRALKARSLRTGNEVVLTAPYFVDATELGDLLPLTNTEFVTGAEAKADTGELHAAEKANPLNQQAITVCFAMDYVPGSKNRIDKPREYEFWRDFVPPLKPEWSGKLLSLTYSHPATLKPRTLQLDPESGASTWFRYRRIAAKDNFRPGFYPGDITIVNWPQNDYFLGPLIGPGVTEEDQAKHIQRAKQLSYSLMYWMQTEAPRPDGGTGWPELRLRGDILGSEDGLAKYPYIRESRRIKAVFTVLEQHVGRQARAEAIGKPADGTLTSERFFDSVGVGSYHIDLHPSTGMDNYIDFPSLPFQIPLGALLPVRVNNLLPANKNIGTTHVTNGCYRLHPVEWSIGEAVGELVAFALAKKTQPRSVREKKELLTAFQARVREQGIETHWPGGM